jgi:PAS domain S-box-containing protein
MMPTTAQSDPEAPLILEWSPLLEGHPLAHFVYDVRTLELLAVNAAALLRYGCTRDEFLSSLRSDFLMPGEIERLHAFLDGLPDSARHPQQPVWLEKNRAGQVMHADVRGLAGIWQGRHARLASVVDAGQRELLRAFVGQAPATPEGAASAKADAMSWAEGLRVATPDLWLVFDAEQRYAEVSDPSHSALSAPWAEKIGRRLVDVTDPEMAQDVLAHIQQAHATRQTQIHTYERRVAAGQLHSFETRYVALQGGRTLALMRDVTQMRLLEHRFRALADAAPIGIYMTDPSGACTYTNAAWQALYGLDSTQSQGHGWSTTLHPQDLGKVIRAWQHHAERKQSFDMEFRVLPPGQPLRVVWARANPILDGDGTVVAHVGAVVDITMKQELQAERQARAVAEEAGRQQTAFMSRASHELRTPLNAILGFGELLQIDPVLVNAPAAAYVGHVLKAGRHMLALVDDLLELQRLQQDQRGPAHASVQVDELLRATQQMLQPMAQSAGVLIELVCPEPISWQTDERLLRQMVLNLASNAIKYGGKGSSLRLSAHLLPAGMEITVDDNGPGMTSEQLARLFKPFDRLGQDRLGVPGTGLGLVITRQMADVLGAELVLRSQAGTGTQGLIRFQTP